MSEEKKLTNDVIIHNLKYFGEEKLHRKEALDLINRLQSENKALHKLTSKTQLDLMFEQAKTIEQQKVEIERLESETEEQYKRIMELEQDLVHADEKVFYRECDVALNEKKIANKALNEFAEKIIDEAFVVFMGDPIIRASKVRELLKEFTNEN